MEKIGLEIILPEILQKHFDLISAKKGEKEWVLELVEKESLIPESAKRRSMGKKVVLNGYRKKLELVTSPLSDLPCYLVITKRRWKIEGTRESYENHYKLHPKGLKCTIEFGNFLKGVGKRGRRKFFRTWPNLRHIREEDFSLVSRTKRLFARENRSLEITPNENREAEEKNPRSPKKKRSKEGLEVR